jgi:hypothetical protein
MMNVLFSNKLQALTWMAIQLGTHVHPIVKGIHQETIVHIKDMVSEEFN